MPEIDRCGRTCPQLPACTRNQAVRIVCDLWVAQWAEAPIKDGISEGGNAYWVGSYAVLSFSTLVLCLVRSTLFMAFARRTSRKVHRRMLARALRAPVNLYFDTVPTSQILNRLGKDLDVVDSLLPHYLLEFFQDWTFLLGTFAIVAWKAAPVLVAAPFCACAFVRVRRYYMATSRELKRLEAVSRSPLLAALSEAMEGITTIRALHLEKTFEQRFAQRLEENATLFWHSFMLLPWLITRIDFLGAVFVLATAISLALLRSSSTAVSGGVAFTFIVNWVGKLQWAVRQSIEAETYLTSVERCEHFDRIPQELEPATAEANVRELAEAAQLGCAAAIEFCAVSVRYRPRLPLAIKGLSFLVRAGERVGVIGRTGCGKSTLALCLFRLLQIEPDGGEVRIFGFNVLGLCTTTLRRAISAVPQVPLVYAGSLRENLDPLAQLPDDRLWVALESVGLAGIVRQAPEGLDMRLAESGVNLSMGQRQLLTIARAALREARLVVCDEATSSCDPKTDTAVQRLLQGHSRGLSFERTEADGPLTTSPKCALLAPFAGVAMLTIAHRLDTLATYDRVLLLTAPTATSGTGVQEIVRLPLGGSRDKSSAILPSSVPERRLVEISL